MSNLSKKVLSVALAGTTLLWASGALLSLPVANAATASDLQAQINALLAQIQQLQAQLATAKGGSSVSCTFTKSLTVGSKGSDVKCLQQYLNGAGYKVAASGAGSPGNETEYFGPATKAAVAKWQAAKGVSPAVGYFGPISRAKYQSLASASSAPASSGSNAGAPASNAPASGLSVSLAADNPAAGSAIAGAGRVSVLAVNLTAGVSSGITVSDLKFHKIGVVSDSQISGAYLVEKGQVIAQYQSLSNGILDFSGLNLSVAAGQSLDLMLQVDLSSSASAGNTLSWSMNSASDVSAVDASNNAVAASATFPLNGNTQTVTSVSNPSLATLTVASSSIGSSVDAGTQSVILGAWTFTGANSKLWLKTIKFSEVGSANPADLRNIKLLINGTQYGATMSALPANAYAYFDLSSNPATINTGANNVQLQGDVMGSPNKNFQFEILNSYDIYATDSQYNTPVLGASNTGTQVSINTGSITVNADTSTPTGNIATNQTNVTLAKYDFYAAGEAVKVRWLTFNLVFVSASGTLDQQIKNIHMDDDVGGSLGSTISDPTTSATCTDHAYANSTSSAYDCFGNSSSPINYIIPANTTRVLSLKGDIQSNASFTTLTAKLVAGASNLQGLTSSQTASSGAASGSALTLSTSALTLAKNNAIGTQTVSAGATGVKIGSYSFTASSAEGVNVSNLTVTVASVTYLQNLKVMINGSQFGTTIASVPSASANSFSGTAFAVPAGSTVNVDVYADVLSSASAGTTAALTTLSGCSGSGATSGAAVSCTSTAGQSLTIAGQATLQVSADNSQAAAGQLVMGSTQQSLATLDLTETTNIENIKVTDLTVVDQVASTTSVKAAVSNLKLYDKSGTVVGTAGSASASGSTMYSYAFHFATPLVAPQAGQVSYTLKGDVASYSSSGATDNTTHVFKVANADAVTALGQTSNNTSTVSLSSPNGNTMTVLRSNATLAGAAIGSTTSRAKSSVDDLGTLTFSANSAGSVAVNTVTVTFSGTAPSISTFLDGVTLLDANGSNVVTADSATVSTSTACNGTNTCTKSWNFGAGTAGWTITGGNSYAFKLRTDDTKTLAASNGVSQSLTATVNANTDITYTDGVDSNATTGINLPSNVVPITVNSVSFAAGS